MHQTIRSCIWIFFAFAAGSSPVSSAQSYVATPVFLPDENEKVAISVVHTEPNGETRFSTEMVQLHYWFSAGDRTEDQSVEKFGFYHLDKSFDAGFHVAPRTQFLVILKGTLRIETTDGERRDFVPGSVFLVTDTKEKGSRGHQSKAIGDENVFAAVASIPNDTDLSSLFSR